MESGITISNGLGWSPDNRIFYYTDTPIRSIYAYDFDADTGAIHNRRVFAQIPEDPKEGTPDGLAVDQEGCIWSARWGGWKISRYDPDGKLERVISMPVEFPTSCVFGGEDLSDLYITSAWTELGEQGKERQPWAGDIFRLHTDIRGQVEPSYDDSLVG
jgi:sugar lactone lactonase YvrE